MITSSLRTNIKSLLVRSRRYPKSAAVVWLITQILGLRFITGEYYIIFSYTVAVSNDHHLADSYLAPAASSCSDVFKFQPIQSSEVLSALQGLATKKSAGPDGVSAIYIFTLLSNIDIIILITPDVQFILLQ